MEQMAIPDLNGEPELEIEFPNHMIVRVAEYIFHYMPYQYIIFSFIDNSSLYHMSIYSINDEMWFLVVM